MVTTTIKSARRRIVRGVLAGAGLLLLAGVTAPFIDAARYSGRIREALEASLGRKVEFDKAHLTLFSGPGLSLEGVTIHEDSRYGVEPFASVPTLEARIRLDKLLLGRVQFSSLRLVEPSVNLVKRNDGTWNVVELVQRISAPQRISLNFFPALEISDGRIDLKFGTRKTTLYFADSDLSIYPEASGKLYVQFSGSPARTDRAGIGFGHVRGTANWFLRRSSGKADQVDAKIILDSSNLSELTTLVEGYDVGIHGTISGSARIEGPPTGLHLSGDLRLGDVHRWDLLPASGEEWRIRYQGDADLLAHSLYLETLPWHSNEPAPVALQVRVNDFLRQPAWSILARLNDAPAQKLLPLARRMGLSLPQDLALEGTLNGVIGYSNRNGFAGGVSIKNLVASLPRIPELQAANATASISSNCIHFDPATISTALPGTLLVGGDYYPSDRRVAISLNVDGFPMDALKSGVGAWLSPTSGLADFDKGDVTGQIDYSHSGSDAPLWRGQLDFVNARVAIHGLAAPLVEAQGQMAFDPSAFDVNQFSANLGDVAVQGEYHYSGLAKHPERMRLEVDSADLSQIEAALEPTFRAQDFFGRLGFGHRKLPEWLATRNLEANVSVGKFSVNRIELGRVRCHFVWHGPDVDFSSVQLDLPEGFIRADGNLNVAGYSPRYSFRATATDFPWRDGLLNAEGEFQTSGTGAETVQNLRASGSFTGEDLELSTDDAFSEISGLFDFSFDAGWPRLRLLRVEASDGEEAWQGDAASESDGKLIFDLEHAGRQRRVVSTLLPEIPAASSALIGVGQK